MVFLTQKRLRNAGNTNFVKYEYLNFYKKNLNYIRKLTKFVKKYNYACF